MSDMVIVGATLIDGTGGPPIENAVLEIAGERIVNVTRDVGTWPTDGAVVDGRGLTLVPGLIDAHVHVANMPVDMPSATDPEALWDAILGSFIEHGVTAIRDTGSPDLGWFFQRLKAGRPDWPRFFGSGPDLDGPPGAPWPGLQVISTPEEGIAEVKRHVAGGADLIKIYVWMTSPVAKAIIRAAHELGVPVAAHVGHVMTVEDAVLLGVDALEHVRSGPEFLTDAQHELLRSLPRRSRDPLGSSRAWRYADPRSDRARRSADLIAEHGVVLTPTLVLSRALLIRDRPVAPVELGMPEELRSRWANATFTDEYSADDWAHAPLEFERQSAFLGMAFERGVRIAAGTDGLKLRLVPGASLIDELELLVGAGLPPLAAISAATQGGAEAIGRSADIGTLAKRKLADLVVVRGDPARDVGALRAIVAVIKSGQLVFGNLTPYVGDGR